MSLLAILILGLSGCAEKRDRKPPMPPMKVGVSTVEQGDFDRSLHVSGTVQFIANTTVSAEVSAQIKSIEVSDGQAVERGQVLLVFDDTKIKETANHASSALKKDEATLAFNRAEWEKNVMLLQSQSISQLVFDQKLANYQNALAQVEADKALLAKAMEDLNKTQVTSPIKGRLSKRYVEKGDWVSEGGKLFQVSDYTKSYLEAYLSDLDLAKLDVRKALSEGLDAEVGVDSYPGKVFKGSLKYIEPVANQSRLFQIRIYVDNPDMAILQGMFARGRIVYESIPGTVMVPVTALLGQLRNNQYNTVFLVDNEKKAALTRVKVGANNRRYAQVLEGLNPGDAVVVQGKEILNTGQLLSITEVPKPAPGILATQQ
ncbi:MAG: efflux RND transporter periplasmic adaptor subunit [Desulfomonile tiedjei]|nr:efflux RND transporter periplasmic adaptor subunit [Desulfomonile tiedjei]